MNGPVETCDVLALSPHPDDADLFCGGTLAALAASGLRVQVVDLSAGELGTNGDVQTRREESLCAVESLGIDAERTVIGLPDGGLDHRAPLQRQLLVQLLRTRRPALLLAPWKNDRHSDHREASLLARDAHFWAGVENFEPAVGAAHRPPRLLYYPCHREAPVNCFVDVTDMMPRWESALLCYASQVRSSEISTPTFLNRPEFVEGLRARRRVWGEHCGVPYAEAFVSESGLALAANSLVNLSERGVQP